MQFCPRIWKKRNFFPKETFSNSSYFQWNFFPMKFFPIEILSKIKKKFPNVFFPNSISSQWNYSQWIFEIEKFFPSYIWNWEHFSKQYLNLGIFSQILFIRTAFMNQASELKNFQLYDIIRNIFLKQKCLQVLLSK